MIEEELVCKECGRVAELKNGKWEMFCGHHNSSQLVTREVFHDCIKWEQRGAEDAIRAMARSHGIFLD